jgi:hypothetical protein
MSELACSRQPRSEHCDVTRILLWTIQGCGDTTFGMRKGIGYEYGKIGSPELGTMIAYATEEMDGSD